MVTSLSSSNGILAIRYSSINKEIGERINLHIYIRPKNDIDNSVIQIYSKIIY